MHWVRLVTEVFQAATELLLITVPDTQDDYDIIF